VVAVVVPPWGEERVLLLLLVGVVLFLLFLLTLPGLPLLPVAAAAGAVGPSRVSVATSPLAPAVELVGEGEGGEVDMER